MYTVKKKHTGLGSAARTMGSAIKRLWSNNVSVFEIRHRPLTARAIDSINAWKGVVLNTTILSEAFVRRSEGLSFTLDCGCCTTTTTDCYCITFVRSRSRRKSLLISKAFGFQCQYSILALRGFAKPMKMVRFHLLAGIGMLMF